MTLLMEGKESRAQLDDGEFQFTGDTPALYYAQQHGSTSHNNAKRPRLDQLCQQDFTRRHSTAFLLMLL